MSIIRNVPFSAVLENTLETLLHPFGAAGAIQTSWLMEILGKPAEGRAALQRIADKGIPIPMQP